MIEIDALTSVILPDFGVVGEGQSRHGGGVLCVMWWLMVEKFCASSSRVCVAIFLARTKLRARPLIWECEKQAPVTVVNT